MSLHHRLNGSSSPVVTVTSLSYGSAKNSTPHRIKTPDLIEIKFGPVDYVGEEQIPPKGASRQMGKIYTIFFIYVCLQVRPLKRFLRLTLASV